jgi:hypothetical protein
VSTPDGIDTTTKVLAVPRTCWSFGTCRLSRRGLPFARKNTMAVDWRVSYSIEPQGYPAEPLTAGSSGMASSLARAPCSVGPPHSSDVGAPAVCTQGTANRQIRSPACEWSPRPTTKDLDCHSVSLRTLGIRPPRHTEP